jgi:hypothetical protein
MGCVFGSEPGCDAVVVYGIEDEDMRAMILSGEVLFDSGRCRGEKKVCRFR